MAAIAPTTTANGKRYRRVVDSFTRPSDTNVYAAGDLIANSTTAGSVTTGILEFAVTGSGSAFEIPAIRLQKTGASATNASFRLRLYSATPTIETAGDNGVLADNVNGNASLVAYFDGTLIGHKDGCVGFLVPDYGVIKPEYLGEPVTLYGVLEARAAYTPSSAEVFTVTVIQEFSI